jgi:hypothetical protein
MLEFLQGTEIVAKAISTKSAPWIWGFWLARKLSLHQSETSNLRRKCLADWSLDKLGNLQHFYIPMWIFFFIYRTRAIITRGLYFFYPVFHCGLYLRAVYTAERLIFTWIFFHLKSPQNLLRQKDEDLSALFFKVILKIHSIRYLL